MVEKMESGKKLFKGMWEAWVGRDNKKKKHRNDFDKNVTDRKQRGGRGRRERWARQQSERKTKRTAYLHGEGRKRANGKKEDNPKHKSRE